MTPREEDQFLKTIGRLFDGTAADVDTLQFTQRLAQDVEARAAYMEFIVFDFELEWLCGKRPSQNVLSKQLAQYDFSTVPPDSLPSAMPLLSLLPGKSNASSSSNRTRRMSRFVGLAASIVVIAYFAVLAAMLGWDRYLRSTHHDNYALEGNDLTVATVSNTAEVRWSSETVRTADDAPIRQGESLKIESGTIELELNTGTKLVVEGPADWSVDGSNRVSLRAGKLVARVPARAIGFTLETPMAKIVDLGTEFDVEVSKSGTTDVRVSKGKVELHPAHPSSLGTASPPITLSAGTARRIEVSATGESIVREIAHEPHRFGPQARTTQAARLPVTGAMASSEYGFIRQAHTLINGSGLNGDRHVNYANHTMWVSALGHVENEFVLFDLGRVCQLDTMKVWNYNETRQAQADTSTATLYQERGVAVADIYVSDTGKWDPLKRPEEWRLVIADYHFEPADGTTDYATPDVISLGEVKARFVAIVIKAKHQSDRPTPDMRCVGLSEVQFFGKRINSRAAK